MLRPLGFEEGRVEIRHPVKFFLHHRRTIFGMAREYLKKQCIQFVKIMDLFQVQKRIFRISLVVREELSFEQFEKKDPVDPDDTKFQRHIEEALLTGIAILPGVADKPQSSMPCQFG